MTIFLRMGVRLRVAGFRGLAGDDYFALFVSLAQLIRVTKANVEQSLAMYTGDAFLVHICCKDMTKRLAFWDGRLMQLL